MDDSDDESDVGSGPSDHGEAPTRKRPRTSVDANQDHHSRSIVVPGPVVDKVGGDSIDDLINFVSSLQFTGFVEHLSWRPSLRLSAYSEDERMMISNMSSMIGNIKKHDGRFGLRQHLEIAKQIEIISNTHGRHTYCIANDLFGPGKPIPDLSVAYAKEILRVSWAVHRYPVLSRVQLRWVEAIRFLPFISQVLDKLSVENRPFPDNILEAQKGQYAYYLRISIQFPQRVGDGDGLPLSDVRAIHGFLDNERDLTDDETADILWEPFKPFFGLKGSPDITGKQVRSRIVGYDTQEAPKPQDTVPQIFWSKGRDFLESQLEHLRQGTPFEHACVLLDVFGVDIFDRFLVDVRGVYDARLGDSTATLRRFEMAERALESGYAFPTVNYYTNEVLMEKFQESISQERGGFSIEGRFINPSVCRLQRYRQQIHRSLRRRRQYYE